MFIGKRRIKSLRGGGDFFCPQCYQPRRYQTQFVYQYATLMMLRVWRVGVPERSAVCASCGAVFSESVLEYNPDAEDRQFVAEVLRINVLIAMIGGRLEPVEIATIQRLYRALAGSGLTREEIEDEVRQAYEEDLDAAEMVRRIGRTLGGEGARIVAQHAYQVAVATGSVSVQRQEQLDQFPAGLGISAAAFQQLIEEVRVMSEVRVVDHPLVKHHLARLRDVATAPPEFRRLVQRLAVLLAYEATQDLELTETEIQTPLEPAPGSRLTQRLGLVPILRAGLGMVDPILNLIPDAEVWHLGLYRDEETAQPVEYYSKLPPGRPVDMALVVDPMLATGGSAVAALETLRKWGVKETRLLSIIAAPEGIQEVGRHFPATVVHVCAVDERLNDQHFIVPGLGDAGDRIFDTRHES